MTSDVTSSSQVGLVGQPLLLPCHVTSRTPPTGDVTEEARPEVVRWLRPRDSAPISRDGHVTVAELTSRMRILDGGNLLISYARFPDDNGTWTCLGFELYHSHASSCFNDFVVKYCKYMNARFSCLAYNLFLVLFNTRLILD